MFKYKIYTVVGLFLAMFIVFILLATEQAKELPRDAEALLSKYHSLKKSNRPAAKKALLILLAQDPKNVTALAELNQFYEDDRDCSQQLPLAEALYNQHPKQFRYALQAARCHAALGNLEKAYEYYALVQAKSLDRTEQLQAAQGLDQQLISFITPLDGANNQRSLIAALPAFDLPSPLNLSLLNRFYQLKNAADPRAAGLLRLVYLLDRNRSSLNDEMGYLSLNEREPQKALDYFLAANEVTPTFQRALQIAYLYFQLKSEQNAKTYFLIAARATAPEITAPALKALAYLAAEEALKNQPASTASTVTALNSTHYSEEQLLLDAFYTLKKTNKAAAFQQLLAFLEKYPKNLLALKEASFLAIELKKTKPAIVFFTRAYNLSFDPKIAMQLGYLHDMDANKYLAYHYFWLATRTDNAADELRAQNSLTNLAGLQTKRLPAPYFGEIFLTPFTQSRFGLTISSIIARSGLEFESDLPFKSYLTLRRVEDNKSFGSQQQLPQIYEDNVLILGGGFMATPLPNFPLVTWIEVGAAYDLIYRNRDRWRKDIRGGAMYFGVFGKLPAYYGTLRIAPDYYATYYADLTYFSRYNNLIGTLKTHQGIHLIQHESSLVNVYLSGRIIEDTQREFYNNIGEIGPGIGFIPFNRYNFEVRCEYIWGVYLPAGGSFNPYGKYYTNRVVQLLYYLKV